MKPVCAARNSGDIKRMMKAATVLTSPSTKYLIEATDDAAENPAQPGAAIDDAVNDFRVKAKTARAASIVRRVTAQP